MYLVYILRLHGKNKSYIGMTNDFFKRWQQHNKYIKGGAKYTTNNIKDNTDYWEPICIIDGFENKSEAMQCEWKLKRVKGYYNRIKNLSYLLDTAERWTKNSPVIKSQNLSIYTIHNYQFLFNCKINELFWF